MTLMGKDEEMLKLHQSGDCYISLVRSEGWGLGAFDAAGSGKPVIITGFGGQLDYLPDRSAYLVKYKMIEVNDKNGGKSYTKDQQWAEPDLTHGSKLMREVYNNKNEAIQKGQNLKKYINERFNEDMVIRNLIFSIQDIKDSAIRKK